MTLQKRPTRINHPDGSVSIINDNAPTVVTFKADAIAPGIGEPAAASIHHKPVEFGIKEWAEWGDGDLWPFEFLAKLDKIGVALTGIDINGDMHYGAGVGWFEDEVTEDGKVMKKPVNIKAWNDFEEKTNFNVTHSEVIQSLETFYIAFVEVILTKNKKNIHSVKCLDTPFCRIGKKNDSGKISKMYFVHDADVAGKDSTPINLFDPKNPTKYGKFALILKYKSFGQPYYTTPNINSTFLNGWADVAIDVPKIIKSIYKNQATLKYHITIPLSALKAEHSNYDELSAIKQIEIQENKKSAIDQAITSAERSGISVMSVYNDLEDMKHIEIEPIKSFLDATSELPNAAAANSEILFSLGTDPSLVGSGMPGGKNLSGSGSDKRESRENKQKNLKRERLVSLQLVKVIKQFISGIPENAYPAYIDADNSQTLDKNPTGSQNIVV
jgi:hypothetical protein